MASFVKSEWRLEWDPDGVSLVLLDYDERMEAEPTLPQEHSVRVQPYLRAAFPAAYDSGNVRLSMAFTRLRSFGSPSAVRNGILADTLVFAALRSGTLEISVRDGDVYRLTNAGIRSAVPSILLESGREGRVMWSFDVVGGTLVKVGV